MLPFLKKKPLKVDILESIVEYVIGEMRPLSVVEKPPFRKLVQRLANIDEVQIPCRKTVKTTIDEMRAKLTNDIIKILEQIPYVCTYDSRYLEFDEQSIFRSHLSLHRS